MDKRARPLSRADLTSWRVTLPFGLAAAGTVFYLVWVLLGQGAGTAVLAHWIYCGAIAMASVACFARATLAREVRGAWAAFGLGLASWAAGTVYYFDAFDALKTMPYPSWADAGYLAAMPCFFVGVASLIKHRIGHFTASSWLDGAIGALGAAALGTALIAPALVDLTHGDPATVLTNLAYPLGYLMLIGLIAGAVVITGVRGSRPLLLIATGLFLWAGVDMLYLYQLATSSYSPGLIDMLWPLATLFMVAGAYFPLEPRHERPDRSSLLLPGAFTVLAAGLLVWDHSHQAPDAAVYLAGATIIAAVVRLAFSYRENANLAQALRREVMTDALTGLGNRRALLAELEDVTQAVGDSRTYLFATFDLDGFKAYNDTFGHPAGDALLHRLGNGLDASLGGRGRAYRLGGDEFCVLINSSSEREASGPLACARAALQAEGEGFSISASAGMVIIPTETRSATAAMHIADNRMYADKAGRPGRADRHTLGFLKGIVERGEPLLADHQGNVERLAQQVAREFDLDSEGIDIVIRAAELHDIGKIAIPREILDKPGRLDPAEWELMKKHTVIGQRILNLSPAMAPVGQAVRSSHERWDGAGYPDGLAGALIPLAARIVFVCDAFDAMRSVRPYSEPMSVEDAVDELRSNAGTQFDADVVDVFCDLVTDAALDAFADRPGTTTDTELDHAGRGSG